MTAQTTPTTIDRIKLELQACIADARQHGYDGPDAHYTYTAADLEAVTDALGAKPTLDEWTAAGLPHVGSAHVGSSSVIVAGQRVDFDGAVALMDADLRERLDTDLGTVAPQVFIDAYAAAHEQAFGEPFLVN